MAWGWKRRPVLFKSWAISLTKQLKGNFRMSSSVLFWYQCISLRATVPGRHLMGLFRPPVWRFPRFFWVAAGALAAFRLACSSVSFFRGACEGRFWRGVLPVFFLAVFLVLAISLKYKESLGSANFPGLVASNRDRSFPFGLLVLVEGSPTPSAWGGEFSGVLRMLVFGVELNSEQTEPKSLQPV